MHNPLSLVGVDSPCWYRTQHHGSVTFKLFTFSAPHARSHIIKGFPRAFSSFLPSNRIKLPIMIDSALRGGFTVNRKNFALRLLEEVIGSDNGGSKHDFS